MTVVRFLPFVIIYLSFVSFQAYHEALISSALILILCIELAVFIVV